MHARVCVFVCAHACVCVSVPVCVPATYLVHAMLLLLPCDVIFCTQVLVTGGDHVGLGTRQLMVGTGVSST